MGMHLMVAQLPRDAAEGSGGHLECWGLKATVNLAKHYEAPINS